MAIAILIVVSYNLIKPQKPLSECDKLSQELDQSGIIKPGFEVGGTLVELTGTSYAADNNIVYSLKIKGYKKELIMNWHSDSPNATLPYEIGKFYSFNTNGYRISGAHSGEFLGNLTEITCTS